MDDLRDFLSIWGKTCQRQPLNRPQPFQTSKGCLPQALLGPLSTLPHLLLAETYN